MYIYPYFIYSRQSRKVNGNFYKPVIEDIAFVNRENVILSLQLQKKANITSRLKKFISFCMNLDAYSCE